jgi:hypothetical protein
MLAQGESAEAHAFREKGMGGVGDRPHLGRDRKTVRAYLSGRRAGEMGDWSECSGDGCFRGDFTCLGVRGGT